MFFNVINIIAYIENKMYKVTVLEKLKNSQELVEPLNSLQPVSCSHQMGCSLWNAGDTEELGGGSSWWRGFGTGVWADTLSPRPCPEDTPHAAHAVPLLRQVSPIYCLTYKRQKNRQRHQSQYSLTHPSMNQFFRPILIFCWCVLVYCYLSNCCTSVLEKQCTQRSINWLVFRKWPSPLNRALWMETFTGLHNVVYLPAVTLISLVKIQ